MIIQSHTIVNSRDVSRYAWSELRRFHNVRYVYDIHKRINGIDDKYKKFAVKQAEQIRFCLIQAREYASAAEQVSLSTRPVLMYYSCMSLALAEILMKQTGDSSLDVARKVHNHHGLTLEIDEMKVKKGEDLRSVASAMRAEPMVRGGNIRAGTFELWHRSARGLPTVGKNTVLNQNMTSTTGTDIVFTVRDERMEELPRNGISLFDCFCLVPGFSEVMRFHDGADKL
ncbi:YaaC family protein [Methylobacterium fujisawaense]